MRPPCLSLKMSFETSSYMRQFESSTARHGDLLATSFFDLVLCGFDQRDVINLPHHYVEQWYTKKHTTFTEEDVKTHQGDTAVGNILRGAVDSNIIYLCWLVETIQM